MTKFNKERLFQKTSKKDALRLIKEEFKEGDAESTLEYIMLTCKDSDKIVEIGSIKFKVEM